MKWIKTDNWLLLAKTSVLTSNVLKLDDMTNWRVYNNLRRLFK